jgi:hypothetical protein
LKKAPERAILCGAFFTDECGYVGAFCGELTFEKHLSCSFIQREIYLLLIREVLHGKQSGTTTNWTNSAAASKNTIKWTITTSRSSTTCTTNEKEYVDRVCREDALGLVESPGCVSYTAYDRCVYYSDYATTEPIKPAAV